MRWLLNLIYLCLLLCVAPLVIWRAVRHGRYRRGWKQKVFGLVPPPAGHKPRIWFHAVSVGEVVQLARVVEAFVEATGDQYDVVVSASTDTGFDLARRRLSDHTLIWFPFDFSWAVSNALRRISPEMLVLMELEVWPNLISSCRKRGVRLAMINARMSPRSHRGYRRLAWLTRPLFSSFQLVAAQSEEYADRLRQLGVPSQSLIVSGSVKFDGVETKRDNEATRALKHAFGIGANQCVVVAGSTQAPEEEFVIRSFLELRGEFPSVRLIIVPRHSERFEEVNRLILRHRLKVLRRSRLLSSTSDEMAIGNDTVGLLDTIGELHACWGLAEIALVGGSFGSRGGQNMIEPAAYGAALMFGNRTWNFRDVVNLFRRQAACVELTRLEDLLPAMKQLLLNREERHALGARARCVVLENRGATRLTVNALCDCLAHHTGADRVSDPRRAA